MGGAAMDAAPITRVNAVIHEGPFQRFGQLFERAEVRVIALPLVLVQNGEKSMMEVVAPLRIETHASRFARGYDARVVQVALGDQHKLSRESSLQGFNFGRELLQKVNGGAID